jgi:nucleoside-diphosphate-sugar epimerase
MRVLVTGATGFVGAHVCKQLVEAGYDVLACHRGNSARVHTGAVPTFIPEIDGETEWSSLLQGVDLVVHLAAYVHQMGEIGADEEAQYHHINFEGTRRLAEQAAIAGVKRFVFVSSIKVNGDSSKVAYTHSDEPHPNGPYAQTKWLAERALAEVADQSGLEFTIVRPPLVYGPGVSANFETLMKLVRSGVPLPFGFVRNKRSLICVHNLADAVKTCLEHPRAANKTFLVSDGRDISTLELVKLLADGMDCAARIIPVPLSLIWGLASIFNKRHVADRLLNSLFVDSGPIRTELGWTPPVSVEEGLRETAMDFLASNA